jgi:hypothetical protein
MLPRLRFIADAEGMNCPDRILTDLIRVSEGDMRKAIMFMQCLFQLNGADVSDANVDEIAGVVPQPKIVNLAQVCRKRVFPDLQVGVVVDAVCVLFLFFSFLFFFLFSLCYIVVCCVMYTSSC